MSDVPKELQELQNVANEMIPARVTLSICREDGVEKYAYNDIHYQLQGFLDRIRQNEHINTFVTRRDSDNAMLLEVGFSEHEKMGAIVRELTKKADGMCKRHGIKNMVAVVDEGLIDELGAALEMKKVSRMLEKASLRDGDAIMASDLLSSRIWEAFKDMGVIPEGPVAGPIRWQAVFFIGPAGSGKSFVRNMKYMKHLDFKVVDPDEIKAQPLSSDVITPTGLVKMGNIKVGDRVLGREGECVVLNVSPRGMQKVYEIEFTSGIRTRCTGDHLWKVFWRGGEDGKREMCDVRPLSDILSDFKRGKKRASKYWIPMCNPVEFDEKPVPVHPYVLGLLLGDGHLDRSISIASGKDDINEEVLIVKDFLGSDYRLEVEEDKCRFFIRASDKFGHQRKLCKRGYVYKSKDRDSWVARGKNPGEKETVFLGRYRTKEEADDALNHFEPRDNRKKMLWHHLDDLGLRYRRAWNKFIPEVYLYNSLDIRLGVIQGMLDSDGCCSQDGLVSYWSCSERLANDFAFLIRSVGGQCSVTRRNKGENREGFSVQVVYDGEHPLFRLRRKQSLVLGRKQVVRNFIKEIKECGEEECQCIGVSSDDGLYLTDNFVVTHNSLHPDYDPDEPFKVHKWSKAKSNALLKQILTDGKGTPVVVDGTGRNAEGIVRKMQLAKENGYRTYIVYVYVPFSISIFRNRNRERFVPEDVIMEQSEKIARNYAMLKRLADKAKVIPNYGQKEVRQAEQDIDVYPVPQDKRPPRPGDPTYGM